MAPSSTARMASTGLSPSSRRRSTTTPAGSGVASAGRASVALTRRLRSPSGLAYWRPRESSCCRCGGRTAEHAEQDRNLAAREQPQADNVEQAAEQAGDERPHELGRQRFADEPSG